MLKENKIIELVKEIGNIVNSIILTIVMLLVIIMLFAFELLS